MDNFSTHLRNMISGRLWGYCVAILIILLVKWSLAWIPIKRAVSFVLSHEGGYSDYADDDGGKTKCGISKRRLPLIDVNALTVEQAKVIYKRDFWEPQLYKDIKDVNLAQGL